MYYINSDIDHNNRGKDQNTSDLNYNSDGMDNTNGDKE